MGSTSTNSIFAISDGERQLSCALAEQAKSTGKRPKEPKHYQGNLFSDELVVESAGVAKHATLNPQDSSSKAQPVAESAVCVEMPADRPTRNGIQSSASESDRSALDAQLPHKHGHFKIHQNSDPIETLESFEFEMYQILLDPEKGDFLQFADNDGSEPLIRQIGTRDLVALIFARRKLADSKLRVRLDAAELDGKLEITQARELANVRKSIKNSRKGLAAKYFVEMAASDAYTHCTITYSVYLPIEVLRRQHAHGWLFWRKGGNCSRILVDRCGRDRPVAKAVKSRLSKPIKEEAGSKADSGESLVKA